LIHKNLEFPLLVLLAEDDTDDCFFFNKALKEIPISTELVTVNDGEQLMKYLSENLIHLPDVLFLDLSMPRKNGFECLSEIKEDEKMKEMSVIMFSTSYPRDLNYERDMINTLYSIGAQNYIRKSSDFEKLKLAIHLSLTKEKEKKHLHR